MLALGLLSAMALFWFLYRRTRTPERVHSFYSILGLVSIGMGLFGAWAFQAIYGAIYEARTGGTAAGGLTFMGGLVFGAVTFVVGTLLFAKPNVKREFWHVIGLAVPALAIALAFGRMGCFFAGCCFGLERTWGTYFYIVRRPNGEIVRRPNARIPTNLFEAIFAFVTCVIMVTLILRAKRGDLNIYIFGIGYPIWRFAIEYARDDQRYQTGLLSPSQWQSIVLIAVVIALAVMVLYFKLTPFRLGKEHPGSGQEADSALQDEETKDFHAVASAVGAANEPPAGLSANDDFHAVSEAVQSDENAGNGDDFYAAPDGTKAKPFTKKEQADAKYKGFSALVHKFFLGALGAGGLLAVIGFILLGTSNRVGMAFLFTFAAAAFMVAAACMPAGVRFEQNENEDEYYKRGFSIFGHMIGAHKK